MATSKYLPNTLKEKVDERPSPLPRYSSDKLKKRTHSNPFFVPVSIPIPFVQSRRIRLLVPHAPQLSSYGRRLTRRPMMSTLCAFLLFFSIFALTNRFLTPHKQWPGLSPATLVFAREELQRIWAWEIEAGHFPSKAKIPTALGFTHVLSNPAVPPASGIPPRYRAPQKVVTSAIGVGPEREYLDLGMPDTYHPKRVPPGSVADLDVVMEHCDFSKGRYVRDCLEVLSVGAALDTGRHFRRTVLDSWKYIYKELPLSHADATQEMTALEQAAMKQALAASSTELPIPKSDNGWEPPLTLRPPPQRLPAVSLKTPCDEENPRIFHVFWAGPFTDKPYMAALSFLYTQNTGLHKDAHLDKDVCRPKFWFWINPGPAGGVANPNALQDMYNDLKSNQWSAPLLHPRFKDVIQFKLWNTTEQLDSIPELKNEWRNMVLLNSGGHKFKVPAEKAKAEAAAAAAASSAASASASAGAANSTAAAGTKKKSDDIYNRLGSKSSDSYDKLSVVLSDMVRFVLCHRYGGIYLDADTLFLRDWEELWGWTGAFAYRWSRIPTYNTAVLRMHRQSALGSFLFRTAVQNKLDFHPMTVWEYTKDASLDKLLLRLPDALFDPAWLNAEGFGADRPAQPYFYGGFESFFNTPKKEAAGPVALGIDGFFKGAYSYHWHNFYWLPMDKSRDFPDLGSRFAKIIGTKTSPTSTMAGPPVPDTREDYDIMVGEKRDLDWSAVFKRTFEAYIRGERPNLYGETIEW